MKFYQPYIVNQYLKTQGPSVYDIWGLGTIEPEFYYYSQKFVDVTGAFSIKADSVQKLFSNITGIYSSTKASIFVVNVTAGRSLEFY